MNGETNVALDLNAPRAVSGLFRETGPAPTFYLWADEPKKMVRELERRLHEPPAPGHPPLAGAQPHRT